MLTALPRRFIRMLVVACGAGVAMVCSPADGLDAQETRAARALTGVVVDVQSDHPVESVQVSLRRPGTPGASVMVEADEDGAFAFPALPSGTYVIHFQRIGYQTLEEDVEVDANVETALTVRLVPEAVDLEPVMVTVTNRQPWFMRAFEQRRATAIGSFVTRKEIDRRRPRFVTDMFRTMPGVRVVPDRRGDQHLLMRGGCVPKLYIDGVAAYEGASIDLAVRPVEVEAIEVYSNASVPIEYAHDACGAVLIWSRPPQQVAGRGQWWKPLILVGGLMGTLALVR